MKYRTRKPNEKIEFIVIHYAGVGGISASALGRYFRRPSTGVSTHYVIDKLGPQEVLDPVEFVAYHVGRGGNGIKNANSVGVDLCERKKKKESLKVEDSDWYFDDQTEENAAKFVAHLLFHFGLDVDRLKRHYDATGKLCPRPFAGEDVNDVYHTTHDSRWQSFVERVTAILAAKRNGDGNAGV